MLFAVQFNPASAVRTLVPEDDLERGSVDHPTFWVRASRGFNLPQVLVNCRRPVAVALSGVSASVAASTASPDWPWRVTHSLWGAANEWYKWYYDLEDVGDELPDVPQEQCDLVLLPDEVATFRKEPEVSHAMAPKKGRDGR